MLNRERIKEWIDQAVESIQEQVWFQQLKAKWEELDPQSRIYLKFAGVGAGILLAILFIFSSIWSVHSLRNELIEKQSLLSAIQNANDEISRLRSTAPGGGRQEAEGSPWVGYFESLTTTSGVDKASLTIDNEKGGTSGDQSKEVLFDLNLKHVNIKQIVRYAFAVENGQRPVKLRNMVIDTKGDPAGFLDSTLSVSAFTLVVPK
jgi:hypothetical protein